VFVNHAMLGAEAALMQEKAAALLVLYQAISTQIADVSA